MLNFLPQINNQIITKPKFKPIAGTQLPLLYKYGYNCIHVCLAVGYKNPEKRLESVVHNWSPGTLLIAEGRQNTYVYEKTQHLSSSLCRFRKSIAASLCLLLLTPTDRKK